MVAHAYSWADWLLLSAYVLTSVVATAGNAFIIRTVRRRRMRTTTFALIANQAFSDLMCGLLYLSQLFLCSTRLLSFGLPGAVVCEASFTLMLMTFEVSILTMTAISVERYLKLCRPNGGYVLQPWRTVFSIWGLALLLTLVSLPETRCSQFFTETQIFGCRISVPTGLTFFRSHYNHVIVLLLAASAPAAVMGAAYYKVIAKIQARSPVGNQSEEATEAFEESKRQMTEMLIVIVVLYFSLCSPLFIIYTLHYVVVHILPEPCNEATDEPWWFQLSYFALISSICLNPFIYCKYNQVIRSEAKEGLDWLRRRPSR